MEQRYFADMLKALSNRANYGTVSWLGFSNVPLRRHLMDVFSRPYGDTGSFLADPTFEAIFGWTPSTTRMSDLSGNLLSKSLVDAMDSPPKNLVKENRFAKDRFPYVHQIQSWKILAEEPPKSLIVTSGTGSGKTECFMVPILDRLAREQEKVGSQLVGVRALFLYPLNALINSQRDRLLAWTHGFGNKVRFCLYNGLTPDTLPAGSLLQHASEIQDRKSLRASPPPILVTNATMLEYMLVRTQDADILEKSKGKLEWIVLDEAHSYVGSQAAELALLIRRVIHAFGVSSENVRFIATSATIGDPEGPAGVHLREFLAQVAGVDISRVYLVSANRQVPTLPSINDTNLQPIEFLRAIDAGIDESAKRYQALSGHAIAKKIRTRFVSQKTSPVARLSEVCSDIFGPGHCYTLEQQQQALDWLDLVTCTKDVSGNPFLPLRAHIFHQTLTGLWCCADTKCPDKQGSKLDDPAWPFGQVFLGPRNHCTCGAPVYEFASCDECGEIYLLTEEKNGAVTQSMAESAVDEFELEIDENDADDLADIPDLQESHGREMLIANRNLPHTGEMYVHRRTRQIVEGSDPDALAITVYEDGGDGLDCPACGESEPLFRKARIGAPFLLGGLLPTLLEYAPDGDNPTDRPYRGRRLLTFSDSRQGTARLAAKLQQDAERTKTRGLIYHHVLKESAPNTNVFSGIEQRIQEFEKILATRDLPDAAKIPIIQMVNSARSELAQAQKPTPVSFPALQTAIAQEGHDFRSMLNTYQGYSQAVFGGHEGASNLAGMFLVRELGRRPRRQNNLETMGMISVIYPQLAQVSSAPSEWTGRGFTLEDWKNFLKITLDYFVRGGGSLELPVEWRNWMGIRFPQNWIVAPDLAEPAKGQRRWPSASRSARGRIVRILAFLMKVDVETDPGEIAVDSVLLAAWEQIKPILTLTGSGYTLRLQDIAFATISQAWICPITRRFLDTTVRGVTPYLPKIMRDDIAQCEKVDIPVYDLAFGGEIDSTVRIRRAREWLEKQNGLLALREEGLWSNVNDRVIELAPYFSAAEHSAQQSSELLDKYEKKFKDGWINLLSCSTTMEMGIDIGGIQLVAMNNVPPHPANYLQRAGRAGRRSETRSTAVTLCKSNPHDQNVFLDTRWAFKAKLPPPVVSLNSAVIVQRHVNSMMLARFLAELLSTNPKDMTKLTCGWFFDHDKSGPSKRFVNWCEAYMPGDKPDLDLGLQRLVRHSLFEGQNSDRLVRQSGTEMAQIFDKWQIEWNALLNQETGLGVGSTSDPAAKAIGFQKRRLAEEYLLRELATQGFLPGYGFPTSIASFDNTTVSAAKKLPAADAPAKGGRDDNRFMKRNLASRDLMTALREYAPGAELVMDGLVYKSAGITLNWHVPANQQDARETQALKFAWRCRLGCGASGTTSSLVLAKNCEACGTEIQAQDIQLFLEPAGFSVDFYDEPHNDVSTQQFVPVERPWISARGEWSPMPNPQLGRFRVTTDGRVYHHSAGLHGKGYALCLACGRAEPMLSDGNPPITFTPGHEHKKLRSRKDDRVCSGSTNQYQIKTGIVLGHQVRTDVLEIQLRDINGQWITDRGVALTIVVALRDELAELIGVQTGELGCDVQETRSATDTRCQSLFIFDKFAAGYASSAERLMNQMFRYAAKRLDCPKGCDSSCPQCVLDFDQRFEAGVLDRKAALAILTPTWLDMLKIPDELRYLGDSSMVEFSGIVASVLRESANVATIKTRLYIDGPPDEVDIASSPIRVLAYRLIALSRPLEIVIGKAIFEGLGEADRFALSSLSDHPTITIGISAALPAMGGAFIIAEICREAYSHAWATTDQSARTPNETWGVSATPLVFGTLSSHLKPVIESVETTAIRPKAKIEGDREIVVHHEIDGPLQGFGTKFWKIVAKEHFGAMTQIEQSNADIVAISYSDRYLFSPLSLALLVDLVSRLKEVVGQARWDNPEITITTTDVRGSGGNTSYNKIFSDWPDLLVRDAVAKGSFEYLGLRTKILVPSKFSVQHGRVLEVRFSDEKLLSVRMDQGVGYWRVPSSSGSKQFSIWFDFNGTSLKDQIKNVVEMKVPVEGGSLPTEVFVKLR